MRVEHSRIDDEHGSIRMILIHESHVFELRVGV